jgi:hemerythrin superfamily protein
MGLFRQTPRTADVSEPVKLLIIDHEKVERLFDEIEAAESPTQRNGLVAHLDAELTRHTTVEEEILYPFIRDVVPDGPSMVEEAEREHAEAKEALVAVVRLDPSTPAFASALKRLEQLVGHHVDEEEGSVFPKLESSADEPDLLRLRAVLEQARMDVAPSPDLPSESPPSVSGPASSSVKTSPARLGSVWVQPHHGGDGRWQVRREHASRASRVFDTQREAEEFGRGVARREAVELILAGRDGSIRDRSSYGNDRADVRG